MIRLLLLFFTAVTIPVLVGLTLSSGEIQPVYGSDVLSIHIRDYPDHIPGAFTGGFGESTCHSCHFDHDLNHEQGSLTVAGLPENYTPGEQYEIRVVVENEQLGNGGFQLTARFKDGGQAGAFDWSDDRLTFTPATTDSIQYIQHSEAGTETTSERQVSWRFVWEAPPVSQNQQKTVFFNIAANAGNDDFSAFGDWIYVKERVVPPAQSSP